MASTLDESASLNGNDIQGTNEYLASKIAKFRDKVSKKVKGVIDYLVSEEEKGNVTTEDLQAGLSVVSQSSQINKDSLRLKMSTITEVASKKAEELASGGFKFTLDILNSPIMSKDTKDAAKESLTKNLQATLGIADQKITDKIIEYATKHKVGLEEAIEAVSKDYQVSDKEKAQLQEQIASYTSQIGKLVEDGALKVDQAKALLAGVDIKNINTSKLSEEGKELLKALGYKVDETTGKITEMKEKTKGNSPKDVDTSKITEEGQKLQEAINSLVNSVASAVESIFNSTPKSVSGGKGKGKKKGSKSSFTGGLIPEYHSDGDIIGIDWKPRGTDTVPTMLTPGEYVLRKKAVESLGLNFLNNLNKYGNKALQSSSGQTIINNVYNTNNAKISQNIDNKSQYLNGLFGIDRLMRYV